MSLDIQTVIDIYSNVLLISLPLGLVCLITEKLVSIFLSFVFGKGINI